MRSINNESTKWKCQSCLTVFQADYRRIVDSIIYYLEHASALVQI